MVSRYTRYGDAGASGDVYCSVSVKRRHSVFDTQNFGQNAQKKKDSASSDAKDFPVDAQFHMAVRQVDALQSHKNIKTQEHKNQR